jgi:hypothetical protein
METVTNVPAKRERKRLSLDVFQEKSIGTPKLNVIGGAQAEITTNFSLTPIFNPLWTLSSDNSQCCKTNDCH